MSFKRTNRSTTKPSARAAPNGLSKPKSKSAGKLSTEKFRAALDGSFDSLREASAHRKLNPSAQSKTKQRTQRLPVVSKAQIDASIDELASLMK